MDILIVDDDPAILEILDIYLSDKYTVRTFNSSTLAFEEYQNNTAYLAVITDFFMPLISGDEFIKKILKINPKQKIIICSGTPSTELDSFIKEYSNAVYHIPKPFDLKEFDVVIESIVKTIG
ncbi:MAG: hypothetical protein COA79_20860 [Planctomycetota bacterium]|nr:MAG: hypothetical protein COA79_20860 [Planctomycetota bacterium]